MIRLFNKRFISYKDAFVSMYLFIIEKKSLIFLSYEFKSNVTDFSCVINIIECIFMMKNN